MKFYCDNKRHLVCTPYTKENLHKMAEQLNIKRCRFHKNYYDIPKRRIKEITDKCNLINSREIVKIIKTGNLIQEIVKKFDINVVYIEKDDIYYKTHDEDEYINRSFIIDHSEIQLGIYDDDNLKLASFFHEIGHLLVTDEFKEKTKYKTHSFEKEAWRCGFELAKEYNIIFDEYVHEWAEKQIKSY